MTDDRILKAIDEEIARLQKVRDLLTTDKQPLVYKLPAKKHRRKMSAAGRKRIAEGQRKRWAKQKAVQKS